MGDSIVVQAQTLKNSLFSLRFYVRSVYSISLVLDRNGIIGMSRLLFTKQKLLPMYVILFERLKKEVQALGADVAEEEIGEAGYCVTAAPSIGGTDFPRCF